MKTTLKTLLATSLLIGAAMTGTAKADSSFNFVVQGEVPLVCQATNNSISATETIDLTSTSEQTLGSITYTCNNPGGFTRTISSANNGALVNGSQSVSYQVAHTGGSGLNFNAKQLTAPETTNIGGSSSLANGQTGALRVTVPSLPTGLLAGVYSDTITVSVTAN